MAGGQQAHAFALLREAEKSVCKLGLPLAENHLLCITGVVSLALYGRLIIVAPVHRWANLAAYVVKASEIIGRSMGAAFLYTMATLKIPHAQRALESAGFRLLGFFPGYDREEVPPVWLNAFIRRCMPSCWSPQTKCCSPTRRT